MTKHRRGKSNVPGQAVALCAACKECCAPNTLYEILTSAYHNGQYDPGKCEQRFVTCLGLCVLLLFVV